MFCVLKRYIPENEGMDTQNDGPWEMMKMYLPLNMAIFRYLKFQGCTKEPRHQFSTSHRLSLHDLDTTTWQRLGVLLGVVKWVWLHLMLFLGLKKKVEK